MKFNYKNFFLSAVFVLFFSSLPLLVRAEGGSLDLLKNVGTTAGYNAATNENTMAGLVGSIINVMLGLLGVIFLAYTVYAGYLWMSAGGDNEKIKTSQKYIKNGVIGMLIVLASFGITRLIVASITASTLVAPTT